MNILQLISFWVSYSAKKLVGFAMDELSWIEKVYHGFDKLGFFIVGIVMYGAVYLYDGLSWMQAHLPGIVSVVNAGSGISGGNSKPSALATGLQFANTIVPLDEAFALAQFLLGLWVLTVTFRIIKSWLPSVN